MCDSCIFIQINRLDLHTFRFILSAKDGIEHQGFFEQIIQLCDELAGKLDSGVILTFVERMTRISNIPAIKDLDNLTGFRSRFNWSFCSWLACCESYNEGEDVGY